MDAAKAVTVTETTFGSEVERSEVLVLVDFWAPWCAPCIVASPILEEIATENEGRVKVAKVNVDENPGLAQRFGIRGIPTIMFFKDGNQVDVMVGLAPKERVQEKVESLF